MRFSFSFLRFSLGAASGRARSVGRGAEPALAARKTRSLPRVLSIPERAGEEPRGRRRGHDGRPEVVRGRTRGGTRGPEAVRALGAARARFLLAEARGVGEEGGGRAARPGPLRSRGRGRPPLRGARGAGRRAARRAASRRGRRCRGGRRSADRGQEREGEECRGERQRDERSCRSCGAERHRPHPIEEACQESAFARKSSALSFPEREWAHSEDRVRIARPGGPGARSSRGGTHS